jgi:hypothetical protein
LTAAGFLPPGAGVPVAVDLLRLAGAAVCTPPWRGAAAAAVRHEPGTRECESDTLSRIDLRSRWRDKKVKRLSDRNIQAIRFIWRPKQIDSESAGPGQHAIIFGSLAAIPNDRRPRTLLD